MKKFYRFLLCSLLLCSVLSLCACTYTVACIENSVPGKFYAKYKTFQGEKTYKIVADGEAAVKVSIVTEDGSLAVTIQKGSEEPVYTGNNLPSMEFVVYLHESGTYTVRIRAEKHSGSYTFSWE